MSERTPEELAVLIYEKLWANGVHISWNTTYELVAALREAGVLTPTDESIARFAREVIPPPVEMCKSSGCGTPYCAGSPEAALKNHDGHWWWVVTCACGSIDANAPATVSCQRAIEDAESVDDAVPLGCTGYYASPDDAAPTHADDCPIHGSPVTVRRGEVR